MLERREADGAFERIEFWLRERGFFAPGGEALAADLFLGYGLSDVIRRETTRVPPEPCPIPLAACAVRRDSHADVRSDNDCDQHEQPDRPDQGAALTGGRT